MTFLVIVGLSAWLLIGCAVALLIGYASDLGCLSEGNAGVSQIS